MRSKIKSTASKIPLIKEQIHKILNEIIENKITIENVRCKELDVKSNLKEIKSLRNNAIAERISLSKELDTVRVYIIITYCDSFLLVLIHKIITIHYIQLG